VIPARPTGWAVTRNATWLAGGRVVNQALAVVLTIVVARGLGATGFGQYAFVGAIIMIANTVTTFGTDALLIREIAGGRVDPPQLATRAAALQLLFSLGIVLLVTIGASSIPGRSTDTVAALRVYALCLLPLAFFGVFSATLRGLERMDLHAKLTTGTAALQTGAAAVALRGGPSLPRLMFALLLAQVGAALLAWWLCRVARPGFALRGWNAPLRLGALIESTWLLALLTGLGMVTGRIGVVLLSLLAGDAPAGWFAAAARVVEGLTLATYSASAAMLPMASRLAAEHKSERSHVTARSLARLLRRSQVVLIAIAVLAAVAASVLAAPIVVGVLYGRAYAPAVGALRVLCWALIPTAAAATASLALVSAGLERIAVLAAALGLVVVTGLGVWLIPRAGVNGACAAVLAGEIVRSVLLLLHTGRIGTPDFAPDAAR
jgi:O-antigen/teichoic acid export membrane protein